MRFSISTMLSDILPLKTNPLTRGCWFLCVAFVCAWQNTEKQMRQLAVIPPMLFDAEQQRIKFINMNGLMDDPMKVYKDRQVMNMWSEQERDTFREKFMQHPKNFGLIASFLERKTVAECVLFYYLTKEKDTFREK